jgi:hypothetical protein|tara:strand:- start:1113 stop:1529 length:417 start_codon:yes stop_codon:yes gene_type:complete
MASILKIKRTNTAGKVPTFNTELLEGELAVNLKDQKLYTANSSAVFQLDQQVPTGTVYQTTATVGSLSENSQIVTNVVSWANNVVDFSALQAYQANTNNWIATNHSTSLAWLSNTNNRFAILSGDAEGTATVDGGSFS